MIKESDIHKAWAKHMTFERAKRWYKLTSDNEKVLRKAIQRRKDAVIEKFNSVKNIARVNWVSVSVLNVKKNRTYDIVVETQYVDKAGNTWRDFKRDKGHYEYATVSYLMKRCNALQWLWYNRKDSNVCRPNMAGDCTMNLLLVPMIDYQGMYEFGSEWGFTHEYHDVCNKTAEARFYRFTPDKTRMKSIYATKTA